MTGIGLLKVKPEGWVEKCIRRWKRLKGKPLTPLVFGSERPRMWPVSIAGKPNSASDACFDIDFTWVTKPEAEFKLTFAKPRVPTLLAHQVSRFLLGDELTDFGFSLRRGELPTISVCKHHSIFDTEPGVPKTLCEWAKGVSERAGILDGGVKDEES